MSEVVLDASALLALVYRETGADVVAEAVSGAAMSGANFSEVVAKLSDDGMREFAIRGALDGYQLDLIPFDEAQAWTAGLLHPLTRPRGLSFADRACLALALALDLPVLTGDRAWEGLNIGVDVRLFR